MIFIDIMQLLTLESLAFTTCQAYVIELAMHVVRVCGNMQLLTFDSLAIATCQASIIELAKHVVRACDIFRYFAIIDS